jgi:hypothetical protein
LEGVPPPLKERLMSTSTEFVANVPQMKQYRIAKYVSDYAPAMYGIMLLLTSFLNRVLSFEMYMGYVVVTGLIMLAAVYVSLRKMRSMRPEIAGKFAEEFEENSGLKFHSNFFAITQTPAVVPVANDDGTKSSWTITRHADGFMVRG